MAPTATTSAPMRSAQAKPRGPAPLAPYIVAATATPNVAPTMRAVLAGYSDSGKTATLIHRSSGGT